MSREQQERGGDLGARASVSASGREGLGVRTGGLLLPERFS